MRKHIDVFLDESGDLGFSPGCSQHFIVVALVVHPPDRLARLMRKCRRKFGSTLQGNPEVKFNRCNDRVRRYVLEGISRSDSEIFWTCIVKSSVGPNVRLDKYAIWRRAVTATLERVSGRVHTRSMHVVIDRRAIKKNVRASLDDSLRELVSSCHAGSFAPKVVISHLDSGFSAGLQAVDHVAGAIFQGVERGNSSYMSIIEGKFARP